MAASSEERGDTRWAVAVCSLVGLVLIAGTVGMVCLFAVALDAVVSSVLAGAFAQFAQAAALYEILLFALWVALRPLNPLFPFFGIPTEFLGAKPGGAA